MASAFSVEVYGSYDPAYVIGSNMAFAQVYQMILTSNVPDLKRGRVVEETLEEFGYGYPLKPEEAREKLNLRKHVWVAGLPELTVLLLRRRDLMFATGRLFALDTFMESPSGQRCYLFAEQQPTGLNLGYIFGTDNIRKDDHVLLRLA